MNATNLINELSSGDQPVEDYIDDHDHGMEKLDDLKEIVENIEVENLEDYQKAMKLKGSLTSLFCYAYNNRKDDYREVSEVNEKLGDKLYKFAKNHRKIKDSELRSVTKYMITCWDRYYYGEDQEKIIRKVHDNDKLRRNYGEDYTNYFIIGLHYNVGDNTFTISSDGSQNRRYIQSCAIQAFYVRSHFHDKIKELEKKGMGIPELEDYYKTVSVRSNSKHSARVYLSRKDKRTIKKKYTS